MTFDFTQTCQDTDLPAGGIRNSECLVGPAGGGAATDLVPSVVNKIEILELDFNLQVNRQEFVVADFFNGDSFPFTSGNSDPGPGKTTESDIQHGLQVTLSATNTANEDIMFTMVLIFETECAEDSYPVLVEGSSIGWITFVRA